MLKLFTLRIKNIKKQTNYYMVKKKQNHYKVRYFWDTLYVYTTLNLKCCKRTRMRFYSTNGLMVLRICTP